LFPLQEEYSRQSLPVHIAARMMIGIGMPRKNMRMERMSTVPQLSG